MPTDQKSRRRSARAEAKRELIVTCAMRHFAEHGYQGARIEDMAAELQIAKGSVFQHYGSKAGLFLECYKRAVLLLVIGSAHWTTSEFLGAQHRLQRHEAVIKRTAEFGCG